MTSRIVIVGQAPGRGGCAPLFPSATGRRLLELAGMDLDQFRERFDCFALRCNFRAAAEVLPHFKNRRVIMLGRGVAKAFGKSKFPLLSWHTVLKFPPTFSSWEWEFAIFPHPSGASPFWNSPANAALARDFLRKAAREVTP